MQSTAQTQVPRVFIDVVTAGLNARLRIEWERTGSAPNLQQLVQVDVGRDGIPELVTSSATASIDVPIPVTVAPHTLEIFASVGMSISGTGTHAVSGLLRMSLIPDRVEVEDVSSRTVCPLIVDPIDVQPNFYRGIDILPVNASPGTLLLVGTSRLPAPIVIMPRTCPIETNPTFAAVIGDQPLRLPGDPSLGTVYLQGVDVLLSGSLIVAGRTLEVRF